MPFSNKGPGSAWLSLLVVVWARMTLIRLERRMLYLRLPDRSSLHIFILKPTLHPPLHLSFSLPHCLHDIVNIVAYHKQNENERVPHPSSSGPCLASGDVTNVFILRFTRNASPASIHPMHVLHCSTRVGRYSGQLHARIFHVSQGRKQPVVNRRNRLRDVYTASNFSVYDCCVHEL